MQRIDKYLLKFQIKFGLLKKLRKTLISWINVVENNHHDLIPHFFIQMKWFLNIIWYLEDNYGGTFYFQTYAYIPHGTMKFMFKK